MLTDATYVILAVLRRRTDKEQDARIVAGARYPWPAVPTIPVLLADRDATLRMFLDALQSAPPADSARKTLASRIGAHRAWLRGEWPSIANEPLTP